MKLIQRITILLTTLVLTVATFLSGQANLSAFNFYKARADEIAGTDVLYDLQQSRQFDASEYPSLLLEDFIKLNTDLDKSNDVKTISVIQIGECVNGDFYIYTYQPLNLAINIEASSIRMSITQESKDYYKYPLILESNNGVFNKYKVCFDEVYNEEHRYYNILEIERPFNTILDEKISDETIIDFKAESVVQKWHCYYKGDELVYEKEGLEAVQIKPTLCDFIFCSEGITASFLVGTINGINLHYIAFNIENYKVDKIVNASLSYISREYTITTVERSGLIPFLCGTSGITETITYGEEMPIENLTLHYTDKEYFEGKGWFANSYKWNRIMTVEEFKAVFKEDKTFEFTENVEEKLDKSQYVFAFTETAVTYDVDGVIWSSLQHINEEVEFSVKGTEITKVDIFRLHFMVGQKSYDLGVVSDTVSGDNIPGNVFSVDLFDDRIKLIVGILLGLALLIIAWPVVSPVIGFVFKGVFVGVGYILKATFIVITSPFKLFKKRRRK